MKWLHAFAQVLLLCTVTGSVVFADPLALVGGTVHPVSRTSFIGTVVIDEGRIVAVGAEVEIPANAARIEAAGLHVYPGMFDAFGQLGLEEISAVAATIDSAEVGTYNPHLLASTAIHPASEVLPVTRANGITHALVAPVPNDDGVVTGQAALVHLAGWTVEEMAVDPSSAMVIFWPEIQTRSFDFATFSVRETPFGEAKEKAEAAQAELRDWFDAARHYQQTVAAGSERAAYDARLAALAKVLDGGQTVIIVANAKRDIESAVAFAEEQGLNMILAGGRDAWMVIDLLKEHDIPVVLGRTQDNPQEEDDPYDRPFRTAGELAQAGIRIGFASGVGGRGPGGPHSARNLPYEAAMAVAYGLDRSDALRALTLWPAQMLGVEDLFGSIDEGKVANLIVTDGDPLEITTQVLHLVIDGRVVSTDNKHESLYQRYRARP